MKKFLAMFTIFAVLSATVVGCGDDKDKIAKDKAAKEAKDKKDKEDAAKKTP